jgi:rSAM/selenodomain-associated transferase 2
MFRGACIIKISIIIPVYNETNINEYLGKIINNKTLDNYELIVVDGNGTTSLELITCENIIKLSSQKGRAHQMNKGATCSTTNVFLFLHADTVLPDFALHYVREALSDETISAGAFDLDFHSDNKALKCVAKIASWRSRRTRLPYGDQTIFIKKEVFESVGGYEDIRLMEDINLMQKLKKQHCKIKILKQKVLTSPRKYEDNGIVINIFRNWVLLGLYFVGVGPDTLEKFYK